MTDVWEEWKEKNGKKRGAMELVRAEVAKQVPLMRQLIAMATQAVNLQRRVWMLDAATGSQDPMDNTGDGGVPSPVQKGTYEDYVRTAEAAGVKLVS
jgi:hypothetical protein